MVNHKFYTFIRKLIRPITNFLWPVTVIGSNKFVEGKGIYVCNHLTLLDPVPFVTELFENGINALMKEESVHMPIIGGALLKMGAIPVNRQKADLRAIKSCIEVLKEGNSLVVFPEGTRNKSGKRDMLEFKEGVAMFALKTQSPIYPMVYSRPIKTFRRTYLLIGDAMHFDEFYDQNINHARGEVIERVRLQMDAMLSEVDAMLQNKKQLKALVRTQKAEVKQRKKQARLAYKQQPLLK